MKQLLLSEKALKELDEIYNYITQYSINSASKTVNKIFEKSLLLKDFPEMGQTEYFLENKQKQYRYIISENYKIIYRIDTEIIYIITLFDTGRNPKTIEKLIKE
jgi:toxin ParE1/3/4